MYGQNATVRAIKGITVSPLFLVGAIGYSVYVVMEFLNGFMGGSVLNRLLNNLLQESYGNSYSFMQGYVSGYTSGYMIVALIRLIPAALIVAGLWITYASAKNKKDAAMSVTGIAIIRVIAIIQLICVCITAALMVLSCIFVMAQANAVLSYYTSEISLEGVLIFIIFVTAGVSAIQIIYYIKLSLMIRTMKDIVITGSPDTQISLYVEIYCYIAGGAAAISALLSLTGMSFYGFLANAGLATADISFAIFLRKYRGCMENLLQTAGAQAVQQGDQQKYQESVQQPYQQQYQQPMQPSHQQQYQQPMQPSHQQQYPEPVQQPVQAQVYNSENETTILPYYNETSVLSGQFMDEGKMKLMRMTRQKTGETFCISKPIFWIGKDAANVDYCITDNTAVSRRHALVTIQNGRCYIRDNHSTNRLFINGQAIQQDVDTLLSDGDRIRMGDEEFIVSIS